MSAGLALQLAIAGAMLNLPPLRALFEWPAAAVTALQSATGAGVQLVFGYLAGGPAPFDVVRPEHGFVLAFQALPLILVVSALSRLLYHWGILQGLVRAFAWMLQRSLGVSGPVGTSAAANIFVGMIEAPLFIRPYLAGMRRGGLFATMTVGMAGIAGTVLALYASILEPKVAGAAGHLIVASVISVPAALMLAALMVPDEGAGEAPFGPNDLVIDEAASSMDAIARGTREGIDLLVNVAAMLIVIVALVALANQVLAWLTDFIGVRLTFEQMLGWCFAPLAWLTGIPWAEATSAGSLLGTKTVLNELVAYLQLSALPPEALSERSRLILTYALCGFANFGSLGIMIGGIAAMVPERRAEIVELGSKTLISGTLATLMTGAVVGLLTPG
ncbi:MAG TPA: nucleoside transporter C-terminal domain-containing protein [Hyphomicrobiaceae bacterium]|nr:nucleoside transporter C-terminal domain-containing protein [Hyphomicrobiaceae bacterium]